jgi:hypothetical protein
LFVARRIVVLDKLGLDFQPAFFVPFRTKKDMIRTVLVETIGTVMV